MDNYKNTIDELVKIMKDTDRLLDQRNIKLHRMMKIEKLRELIK